jgi:hypothetical protein
MKNNTAVLKINGLAGQLIEPRQQIPKERKKFSNADLKTLIIPIIIEQFLALLVGISDTMMISYAGEAAVSGVSLVNQLNNVFIMVFTALASGGQLWQVSTLAVRTEKMESLQPVNWS